jgi:hypothetical protein
VPHISELITRVFLCDRKHFTCYPHVIRVFTVAECIRIRVAQLPEGKSKRNLVQKQWHTQEKETAVETRQSKRNWLQRNHTKTPSINLRSVFKKLIQANGRLLLSSACFVSSYKKQKKTTRGFLPTSYLYRPRGRRWSATSMSTSTSVGLSCGQRNWSPRPLISVF